ncbi:MAG: hypothetical protein EXR75_00115 [Myxococcales bacterium]|nr:hypothetical protein [Myxococcales bacterium]
MIDRFDSDNSIVEFSFAGLGDPDDEEPERVGVLELRRRVTARLLASEPSGPPASALGDDLNLVQRHIGPRLLLLAPLYGYGLRQLIVEGDTSRVLIEHENDTAEVTVDELRKLLFSHVHDDLEQGTQRSSGTSIDLNHVAEAERLAALGQWEKLVELLGAWTMPLAIYWRTPEGQAMPETARQRIAEGLGLLGTACAKLGDASQGEEVMRLAVQYAQDGSAAPAIFLQLGQMLLEAARPGEAIGPLRRAAMLGTSSSEKLTTHLALAQAYRARASRLPALAALVVAEQAGASKAQLAEVSQWLERELGEALLRWRKLVIG